MRFANVFSRLQTAACALLFATAAIGLCASCTIVRDPPEEGGGGENNDEAEQPAVDILVVSQMDRSAAELSGDFERIVYGLGAELGEREVQVSRLGLAPLHRQADGAVPLVYGEGDEDSEFGSLGEAIAYYGQDNGAEHLQQDATAESENLAELGMHLDERPVYSPSGSYPEGRSYFDRPADGFVVLVLSATDRLCDIDDEDCRLDGDRPGHYFTFREDDHAASWLSLPGGEGVDAERVFHGAVVTTEDSDADSFEERCTDQTGFPSTKLEFMEHASSTYYEPLAGQIEDDGGRAAVVDMCTALSSDGQPAIESLADQIAGML